MAVDRIRVRGDLALKAKRGIQVAHELVPVKVEIDPVGIAAAFGTSQRRLIETSRLVDIAHL